MKTKTFSILYFCCLISFFITKDIVGQYLKYNFNVQDYYTEAYHLNKEKNIALGAKNHFAVSGLLKNYHLMIETFNRYSMFNHTISYLSYYHPFEKKGTIGIEGFLFKNNYNYNYNINLKYAKKLLPFWNIGVAYFYDENVIQAKKYNNQAVIINNFFDIIQEIKLYTYLFQPIYNNKKESVLAYKYKVGVGYIFNKNFSLFTEVIKEELIPIFLNIGLGFNLLENLQINLGLLNKSNSVYSSINYDFHSNLLIKTTLDFHPLLGLSFGMSVLCSLNNYKLL